MADAQDLLSILQGGRLPRRSGNTTSGNSEKSILLFKAGKMTMERQPNGKYMVTPDTRRGEINMVWTTTSSSAAGASANPAAVAAGGHLKLEWRDRRTRNVVNTIAIMPSDDWTFQRVETGREGDRVYLLQCGTNSESRHFFWMQDRNEELDEELCVKVNLYCSDYAEAASAAGAEAPTSAVSGGGGDASAEANNGMDNAELLRIMGAFGSQGETARAQAVPGSGSVPAASPGQLDALSNVLENLGMPQPGGTLPSGERGNRTEATENAVRSGGLTLADLQGAMAGLATASPVQGGAASAPGPPLSELASSDIIDESGIMDDPSVVERLTALLPEGQRTSEQLRENIRSPQVAQALQRLTSALVDDSSSFNSIIANFQLNPEDGAAAQLAGNPIEAFLNCLLKDVERKEGVKGEATEEGTEETKDGDEGKDGGDDAKMDES
jgi:hypothetical protein